MDSQEWQRGVFGHRPFRRVYPLLIRPKLCLCWNTLKGLWEQIDMVFAARLGKHLGSDGLYQVSN